MDLGINIFFGWSKSQQIVQRLNAGTMFHPFYAVHVPWGEELNQSTSFFLMSAVHF
jgi:hypothetical protein